MLWAFLLLVFLGITTSKNCDIDPIWSSYLNIVPLPNGNALQENSTYIIACIKVCSFRKCGPNIVYTTTWDTSGGAQH